MKISLSKEVLLEKLSLASKFTSSRFSSISTLQGVLIEGNNEEIVFHSTDLSVFFKTSLKVKGDKSFKAVIEPKKALEILNLLQPGMIDLEIKESSIEISQGRTKTSLALISYEDFPKAPETKEKTQKIKTNFLTQELPLIIFSASSDETRPVLTGVNFISSDEELVVVATDGFRLSLLKTKKERDFPSMLIPRNFLMEIVRLARDEKDIGFNYLKSEKLVLFEIGENLFYSRLIEGEFPEFEKVLPVEKKTRVVIDREEFLRNVRLTSVIARDYSNIVICEFKKDGVYIRPKTDSRDTNEAFQEAEFEGDEQKVAFNFKFLADFLNNIESKKIILEILRPDAPVVLKLEDNKDFLHVIMPIRIQE